MASKNANVRSTRLLAVVVLLLVVTLACVSGSPSESVKRYSDITKMAAPTSTVPPQVDPEPKFCAPYTLTVDGKLITIDLMEGKETHESERRPYEFFEASCVNEKIRIVNTMASESCTAESIIWTDDGRWSCETALGTKLWIDNIPAAMWPQGEPTGGD